MVSRKQRSNRHSKGNDYTLYVAISCAIVLLAIIFVFIARGSGDSTPSVPASASDEPKTTELSVRTEPDVPDTTLPATTEPVTTEPQTTPPPPETVTTSEVTFTPPPEPGVYTGVPYSGPAELGTISKAVFIGDSRTEGLRLYTSILASGARVYANKGLSVSSVYTKAFVHTDSGDVTALDAMRADPSYESVYICLGINELGWQYVEIYTEKYAALIATIREINPSADIYIEGLMPVTEKRSASDETFNNPRIEHFNACLLELAKTLGVHYLNVSEMFAESAGALPPDASTDGIHLNKDYCVKWLDYILEHRA